MQLHNFLMFCLKVRWDSISENNENLIDLGIEANFSWKSFAVVKALSHFTHSVIIEFILIDIIAAIIIELYKVKFIFVKCFHFKLKQQKKNSKISWNGRLPSEIELISF